MDFRFRRGAASFAGLASVLGALTTACGDDDLTCGSGTRLSGGRCVAVSASGGSAGSAAGTGGGAGAAGSSGAGGTAGAAGSAGSGADAGTGGTAGADGGLLTPPEFAGVGSVSPASPTSLLVTWPAATDERAPSSALRYRVYVSTTAGQFGAPAVETGGGAASTLLSGLVAGTEHFVRVRAVNPADLEDANTAELSGTPQADATPPSFAGVTAGEPTGTAGVRLRWDAPATDDLTGASGLVYVAWFAESSPVPVTGPPAAVSAPGAASLVVTLPAAEAPFHFVVRARDAAGNTSANAQEVSSLSGPDRTDPVFSGCSQAQAAGASGLTVSWPAPLDDITPTADIRVRVFVRTDAEEFNFLDPAAVFRGRTSGAISGLQSATTYHVLCEAVDASGNVARGTVEHSATTVLDDSPPVFGGATGVINVTTTTATLQWSAASDDQSAPAEIVYLVYEAAGPAEQVFTAAPSYVTAPGVESLDLTGLTPARSYFFVVRARDTAGNVSANLQEVQADLPVSFSANIQPIFTANCAIDTCHGGTTPAQQMRLQEGAAYAAVVNVPAVWDAAYMRVAPGNAADSYLYMKVTNDSRKLGMPMPLVGTLDLEQIDLLGRWINAGAANN